MLLIVSAVFPPEQIVSANLSKDIAEELTRLGKDVTVISPKPSRPYGKSFDHAKIENKGPRHYVLKSFIYPKSGFIGRLWESISFGMASKRYIRKNKHEITKIYANTWPIFAQYFTIREAKKHKIPVYLHIQDVYPESYANKVNKTVAQILTRIVMPFDKYIMSNAHKIICISEDMKAYLLRTRPIKTHSIEVIRNWQDDDFLTKEISKKENTNHPFTFMYVGSISSSAGVDLLIRAFDDLGSKQDCKLVIAGSGSDREYCMKLANGNTKVEFWDAPFNQVPEIQSEADVLLLCLKKGVGKTATPSKFTAYLFSKKPVLAAIDEGCDTANVIVAENCGFVVPPENEIALRKMMETILNADREVLCEMGNNGFKYAQLHLSKKVNLGKMIKVLTEQ